MGLHLLWERADYSQKGWQCWQPQPISYFSKKMKASSIEHITCFIKKSCKFLFNMAVLLWNTFSVLKLNTHPFLLESLFKFLMLSGIVTLGILHINTTSSFQIFESNITFLNSDFLMQHQCCLLWPAVNASYLQKWESKVSWCQRTVFLPKFWSAQQLFYIHNSFWPFCRQNLHNA